MPYKTYQAGGRKSARGKDTVGEEDTEMKDVTNTAEEVNDITDEEKKKLPWLQRKKEGGVKKIPKDVQKRRRNYRLKKMLTPKPPLMVLHELLGQTPLQYDMSDTSGAPVKGVPTMLTAKTVYDNKTFSGMGPTKIIAKNICAEQVLQHITTKSMQSIKTEEEEGDEENGKKVHDLETDTPWVSLASLALFKLFNDWQAQGYNVPTGIMHKPPQIAAAAAAGNGMVVDGAPVKKEKKEKKEAVPPAEKTIPENANEKHPVQLLNEMLGPMEYEQTGMTGTPPACVFTMAVKANGVVYSGQGKSKKEAKKAAAESAVGAIWNVSYPAV